MKPLLRLTCFYYAAARLPEYLAPMFNLGLRLFLANIFLKSGLSKIQNWDSTLYLFSDVYQVPLLSPELAAYLATSVELVLPVLLLPGLFGRLAAAGLSILNVVAVVSYADLSEAGLSQHLYWGLLLGVLLVSRSAWSVDAWLEKKLQASPPG